MHICYFLYNEEFLDLVDSSSTRLKDLLLQTLFSLYCLELNYIENTACSLVLNLIFIKFVFHLVVKLFLVV